MLVLEGGQIADVAQVTAAMIVLGGTLGAVMVATPINVLKGALKRMMGVIKDPTAPIGDAGRSDRVFHGRARTD